MSVQAPSGGLTPFVFGGVSSANTQLALTIPADPASSGQPSGRQAVITSIDVRAANGTSSAVSGSAIITPTLTNTLTPSGTTATITWAVGNALGAWISELIIDDTFPAPDGLVIAENTAAVFTVPALGAGVVAYVTICGFYV